MPFGVVRYYSTTFVSILRYSTGFGTAAVLPLTLLPEPTGDFNDSKRFAVASTAVLVHSVRMPFIEWHAASRLLLP